MTGQRKIAPALDSVIISACIQTSIFCVLLGFTLGTGQFGQKCFFGVAAFWGGVAVILFRRRSSPTKLDLLFVRRGFFLVCVISLCLTQATWRMRGFGPYISDPEAYGE